MPSMTPDPTVFNFPSIFTGPGEISAVLGRCTAVPFESVWIPAGAAKAGSVEVEGSFTGLSVSLIGNNFPTDPGNSYTVTITGGFVNLDTLSIDFINPNISAGDRKITYTAGGAETVTSAAAGLAALINADAVLQPLGFQATSNLGVITISYPSIPLQTLPQEGFSSTQQPPQNSTLLQTSKTGTGTEVLTVANASSGGSLGAAITTNSITPINTLPRWIKAQFTALTSGSATPYFHGSV